MGFRLGWGKGEFVQDPTALLTQQEVFDAIQPPAMDTISDPLERRLRKFGEEHLRSPDISDMYAKIVTVFSRSSRSRLPKLDIGALEAAFTGTDLEAIVVPETRALGSTLTSGPEGGVQPNPTYRIELHRMRNFGDNHFLEDAKPKYAALVTAVNAAYEHVMLSQAQQPSRMTDGMPIGLPLAVGGVILLALGAGVYSIRDSLPNLRSHLPSWTQSSPSRTPQAPSAKKQQPAQTAPSMQAPAAVKPKPEFREKYDGYTLKPGDNFSVITYERAFGQRSFSRLEQQIANQSKFPLYDSLKGRKVNVVYTGIDGSTKTVSYVIQKEDMTLHDFLMYLAREEVAKVTKLNKDGVRILHPGEKVQVHAYTVSVQVVPKSAQMGSSELGGSTTAYSNNGLQFAKQLPAGLFQRYIESNGIASQNNASNTVPKIPEGLFQRYLAENNMLRA